MLPRRARMRFSIVIAALTVVCFLALWRANRLSAPPVETLALVRSIRTDLEIPLDLSVPPPSTWPQVKFRPLNAAEITGVRPYVTLLIEEFARYPIRFLQESGLKSVVLVRDLSVEGQLR